MTFAPGKYAPGFKYSHWPPAPIFPAQVWGEESAKRLVRIKPKATQKQVTHHMAFWEKRFQVEYRDWPEAGMPRAIEAFRKAYLETREGLIAGGGA